MKLFLDKDAEIKVELSVIENENGGVVVWPKGQNPFKNIDESKAKSYEVFFRYPTYKDNLVFLDSGVKFDDNGILSFVSNQSRYTRFVTLLKRWTFKDEEGKDVAATAENAERLDPTLSAVIVSELEKALKAE